MVGLPFGMPACRLCRDASLHGLRRLSQPAARGDKLQIVVEIDMARRLEIAVEPVLHVEGTLFLGEQGESFGHHANCGNAAFSSFCNNLSAAGRQTRRATKIP